MPSRLSFKFINWFKNVRIRTFIVFLLFILAFLAIMIQMRWSVFKERPEMIYRNFQLPVLDRPEEYNLRFELQKVSKQGAVILFFSTRCNICKGIMPILQKLKPKYENIGIDFLLINVGEDEATVQTFMQDAGLDMFLLMDKNKVVYSNYGLPSLGTIFFIDKDQRVTRNFHRLEEHELDRSISSFFKYQKSN